MAESWLGKERVGCHSLITTLSYDLLSSCGLSLLTRTLQLGRQAPLFPGETEAQRGELRARTGVDRWAVRALQDSLRGLWK